MRFKILSRFEKPPYNAKNLSFLNWDDWNDYSYYTLFYLVYVDENSERHEIGAVKIGYFGQEEGVGAKKLTIGNDFEELDDSYFSLGQDDSYYSNLNNLGEDIRNKILSGLKDIAKDTELYNRAIEENVTKVSLLRGISPFTVTGQFRRIAGGGARLTKYSFRYLLPVTKETGSTTELSFDVVPESYPPSNIHILIGRNGVGKTFLLNNMINTLTDDDPSQKKNGMFTSEVLINEGPMFANLISVSFSAFDESEPKAEKKNKTTGIQYSYIGLKRIQTNNDKNLGPKSTTMLSNEYIKSLNACKLASKSNRWKKSIEALESDPNFKEANIKALIDITDEETFEKTNSQIFRRLSSGHKIVLLTITRLIEVLQEKSLVLIDEPEAHLHPPLLSAFIRSLSDLMIFTNGVAIIATHSPVILQEIPRSCTWKLRRSGASVTAERLEIESFGENVGVLTGEIFGLEVTDSGFYKILNDTVLEVNDYNEVLNRFNGQLGMEAKALVRSLLSQNHG